MSEQKEIQITEPKTRDEFEAYYLLRYQVLREPWNQPRGSEKDDMENECIHIMASDIEKGILEII